MAGDHTVVGQRIAVVSTVCGGGGFCELCVLCEFCYCI